MSLQGIDFGTPGTGGAANDPGAGRHGRPPPRRAEADDIGFSPGRRVEAAGTLDEVIAQDPAPSTLKPGLRGPHLRHHRAGRDVPDVVGGRARMPDRPSRTRASRRSSALRGRGHAGQRPCPGPRAGTKKPAGSTVRLLVIATPVDVEQRFTSVDQAVQNVTGKLDAQSTTLGDFSTELDGVATAASVEAISEKLDAVAASASVDELKQAVAAVGTDVGGLDDKVDDP